MGFSRRLITGAKQCTAAITDRPFPAMAGRAGGFYSELELVRIQRWQWEDAS